MEAWAGYLSGALVSSRLGTKVLGIAYNTDSVPWCGLFVAACM